MHNEEDFYHNNKATNDKVKEDATHFVSNWFGLNTHRKLKTHRKKQNTSSDDLLVDGVLYPDLQPRHQSACKFTKPIDVNEDYSPWLIGRQVTEGEVILQEIVLKLKDSGNNDVHYECYQQGISGPVRLKYRDPCEDSLVKDKPLECDTEGASTTEGSRRKRHTDSTADSTFLKMTTSNIRSAVGADDEGSGTTVAETTTPSKSTTKSSVIKTTTTKEDLTKNRPRSNRDEFIPKKHDFCKYNSCKGEWIAFRCEKKITVEENRTKLYKATNHTTSGSNATTESVATTSSR